MLGDNILDRIVDKTINLCEKEDIRTDREEVEKIFNHIIDRIRYLFDLQKQGLINVGFIEILNFGKFGTAEGFRYFRKQRRRNKESDETIEL